MKREVVVNGLKRYRDADKEIGFLRMMAEMADDAREEKRYSLAAENLRNAKLQITSALNNLPFRERDVLWRHYIQGEYWERIAQAHYYSEKQTRNIGKRALDMLGEAVEPYPEAVSFFLCAGQIVDPGKDFDTAI